MIGDWVKIKNLKNPIRQIICIDEYLEKVDFLDDKELIITSINNIFPILLTPEILEKNKWKKQPFPLTSKETCIGIWRDSKSNTTIKQFFIDRDSSIFVLIGGYSKVGNIRYVHQLQNILRSLGIDKEITI